MPGTPVSVWPSLTPTCRPSPPDSDGDGCVFGGWQPFLKSGCQLLTGTRVFRCQVDPLRSRSCEGLRLRSSGPPGGACLQEGHPALSQQLGDPALSLPAMEEDGESQGRRHGTVSGPGLWHCELLSETTDIPAARPSPPRGAPASRRAQPHSAGRAWPPHQKADMS